MKKFKIVILSEAQDDLKEAFDYYKKIDVLLAKRFLKATKTTVNGATAQAAIIASTKYPPRQF